MSNAYKPSFTATRMFRKTSAKGTTYFSGRLGGVKVALVKSNELAEDGSEIWNLLFSEAAPYQRRDNDQANAVSQAPVRKAIALQASPDRQQRDDDEPFPDMGR